MNKTIYKSSSGYTALMAFYDANLKRWPVPYECLTVPTRHGETHLIASGAPDAPPLVLMRGASGNALLWVPATFARSILRASKTSTIHSPYAAPL